MAVGVRWGGTQVRGTYRGWGPDLVFGGVEVRIGLGLARDGRGVCGDLAVCLPVARQVLQQIRISSSEPSGLSLFV